MYRNRGTIMYVGTEPIYVEEGPRGGVGRRAIDTQKYTWRWVRGGDRKKG